MKFKSSITLLLLSFTLVSSPRNAGGVIATLEEGARRYGVVQADLFLIGDESWQLERALFYNPNTNAAKSFESCRATEALAEEKLNAARSLYADFYLAKVPVDLPRLHVLLEQAAVFGSVARRSMETLLDELGNRANHGEFTAAPIRDGYLRGSLNAALRKSGELNRILIGTSADISNPMLDPVLFDFSATQQVLRELEEAASVSINHGGRQRPVKIDRLSWQRQRHDETEETIRAAAEVAIWRRIDQGAAVLIVSDQSDEASSGSNGFRDPALGYSILRPSICVIPMLKRKILSFRKILMDRQAIPIELMVRAMAISSSNPEFPEHPTAGSAEMERLFELHTWRNSKQNRYLFALNPNIHETIENEIVITGKYLHCRDMGIGSGFPVPAHADGNSTRFRLRLHPGEGTIIELQE